MIDKAREVHVTGDIRRDIVDIVEAYRKHPDLYLGASPRASIMLLRAARSMAAVERNSFMKKSASSNVMPIAAKTTANSPEAPRTLAWRAICATSSG